ncbi:hypothetical protein BC829DRAFT_439608 [Chytridium lagenaria]|nr:hypothetical protein BC829DRAFT_439608 [Chytridium lagenaria]
MTHAQPFGTKVHDASNLDARIPTSEISFLLGADPKCASDAVFLYNDAKQNRYSAPLRKTNFDGNLIATKTTEAMKLAAEIVENQAVHLCVTDRCAEALAMFDSFNREARTLDVAEKIIQHTVEKRHQPSREFIHRTMHVIAGYEGLLMLPFVSSLGVFRRAFAACSATYGQMDGPGVWSTFCTRKPFLVFPEVKDKNIEGGSLDFGNRPPPLLAQASLDRDDAMLVTATTAMAPG